MKKHVFLVLAVALVFTLAPSLEAQSKKNKISWNKRSLVGMEYRDSYINVNDVKFGKLHGGGDNRVVSIMDKNGKETGKTTVDKITQLPVGQSYKIKLTGNHYLEVSGTWKTAGLTGSVYYVIKGPTELFLSTVTGWPNVSIGVSSEYYTWVYFDQATFEKEIATEFVDKYIVPMVDYDAMSQLYNDTRKKFTDYVAQGANAADKEKRSQQCPESIGCNCKGDIPQHMIYCSAMGAGFMGGAMGALPFVAGATAEAIAESKKTKKPATLAACIGKHYGRYANRVVFKDRFRDDAIVLFSGADVPSMGASLTGSAKEEMIMNSSEWFLGVVFPSGVTAIPGLGNVIGFAIGGITAAIERRQLGNSAVDFFKPKPKTAAAPKPAATALKAIAESALKAAATPAPKPATTPAPAPAPKPAVAQTTQLNGVWKYGSNGGSISISGSTGVFTVVDPGKTWQDAVKKGYVKTGDQGLRKLTKTGDLTWTGEVLRTNGSSGNATGVRWDNITITLNADGQTFQDDTRATWYKQ
jgi:hypothetical protein